MLGMKIFKSAFVASILALLFSLPAVEAGSGGCCSIAGSCTFSYDCNGSTCPCLGEELVKFNLAYEHKASGGAPGEGVVKKSSGSAHAAFVLKKDAVISAAAAVKKAVGTATAGEVVEVPRANKEHDVGHSEIIKKKNEGEQHNVLVTKDHKLGEDIVKKASGGNAGVKKDVVGPKGDGQGDVYERAGTSGAEDHEQVIA